MKKLPATAFLFACCISSLCAEDFENWYFEFFSVPVDYVGEVMTPEGSAIETVGGRLTGEISKDGQAFNQAATHRFRNEGNTIESTLEWEQLDEALFKGVYKDSNGTTLSYSLVLKDGKSFVLESTYPDGAKWVSEGSLDADGIIRTLDRITGLDGQLIVRVTTEMKRKSQVEKSGADQPAVEG